MGDSQYMVFTAQEGTDILVTNRDAFGLAGGSRRIDQVCRIRRQHTLPAQHRLTNAPGQIIGMPMGYVSARIACADILPVGNNTSRADRKSTRLNSSHVKISYA